MPHFKRLSAGILVLIVLLQCTFAGCKPKVEPLPSESSGATIGENFPAFINPLPFPENPEYSPPLNTGFMLKAQEKFKLNPDTIAWLEIPDTTIDDVVMFYPGDHNSYYLRRDFEKRYNFYGSYFADYRCTFGNGREGMSRITTIYGHSMEDNPNEKAFSQIKKFQDEAFAKAHPYLYFSTTDEDMAWEVFTVMYGNVSIPYNIPNLSDDEFTALLKECRSRSFYNYNVDVTPSDSDCGGRRWAEFPCCYCWLGT